MTVTTALRTFGRTGLQVSPICLGTAAWGASSPVHGLTVPEADAVATARRALDGAVAAIDTSNNYGEGESERRVGLAVRQGMPPGYLLQTKLDRDPETDSFDPARMRASLTESFERLGVSSVPVLYLHDPEHIGFEAAMAADGPVRVLQELRDEGFTQHIGISGGPASLLTRFVDTGIFDALITHNRFTLVDRTSDALITRAYEAGLGVMNAAVFGGGVLAEWPRTSDRYHYRTAPDAVLAAIDAMGAACARYDVPLIAAALQISTRDPRIHSTICGAVTPEQLDDLLVQLAREIPDELWAELQSLRPGEEHWIRD